MQISAVRPLFLNVEKQLHVFLDWWLHNLRACIPSEFTRKFAPAASRVRLLADRRDVLVSVEGGAWAAPDALAAPAPAHASADISIADEAVLFRAVALPREVLNDLDSAVRFQIKQHVPMDERAVALGYTVEETEAALAPITLTIAAVRNDTVARAFDVAEKLGLRPKRLQTQRGAIELKVAQLTRAARLQRLAIAAGIVLLVVQFMLMPALDARRVRAANEALKTDLTALLDKTKSAAVLKQTVDQRRNEAALLTGAMDQDVFADGLAALSEHAPADVWFSDLQFDGRTFRITGAARDAAGWALKLQQQTDTFENVRLESVSNAVQGETERFQMALQFKAPTASPASAPPAAALNGRDK